MAISVDFAVNDKCRLNVEADDMQDAFKFISYAQNVFGTAECGNCQYHGDGPEGPFKLLYKNPQGYDYFSVGCPACKHELKFGITQEGRKLFPKGWEEPFQGGCARSDELQDDEPEAKPAKKKPTKPTGDKIPW